jgi:hypothetical protein
MDEYLIWESALYLGSETSLEAIIEFLGMPQDKISKQLVKRYRKNIDGALNHYKIYCKF